MDEVADYNIKRWRALAEARAIFTRPALDLDAAAARSMIDPHGWLGELAGARVLCLAGGGGQQSAAFSLLGAAVTVVDLSAEQLARDRAAAERYGVEIATIQGDMRDLSALADAAFDVVWQPYSINFVPDARAVFRQVARVIRPGGLYHLQCANPFAAGLTTADWTGEGYALRQPHIDGAAVRYDDEAWVQGAGADRPQAPVPGPREFRHILSTIVNGLAELGFALRRASDLWSLHPDPAATPGSWDHLQSVIPLWLAFWTTYRPETATDGPLLTSRQQAAGSEQ
jgi:SAM-dependent methyltransferase